LRVHDDEEERPSVEMLEDTEKGLEEVRLGRRLMTQLPGAIAPVEPSTSVRLDSAAGLVVAQSRDRTSSPSCGRRRGGAPLAVA
jgi:hypothetical protein